MLPKHKSECDLERPFQKAYYENEFGSKSIGEPEWRAHVRSALDYPDCQEHSKKGGNGLDWFSSIRCARTFQEEKPNLSYSLRKRNQLKEHVPPEAKALPTADESKGKTLPTYDIKEDLTKVWELNLEKTMGRKKKARDRRNGIGERAPGDKRYYVPECEANFHHQGSTLPLATFGSLETIPDTFIPLVKLPLKPRIPYQVKERVKEREKEIREVNELDNWKPAQILSVS